MPLGGILWRRHGRVLTIGKPAGRRCHSKRLECRGDTGTPNRAESGLGWQWWLVAGRRADSGGLCCAVVGVSHTRRREGCRFWELG
jgi:hypothetical protein